MRDLIGLLVFLAAMHTASGFAQTQTAPAPPVPTLQLPSTASTTCMINCDTSAMNCLNSCVPVGPVTTTAAPGACNLTCTSQQLVCKQRCGQ
jgi:hypothetical protein